MKGRKKHVVSSFSYPVDKIDTVMEVEQHAEKEGKTLSQLIMSLLEQYNESKKVEGLATPIAIPYSKSNLQSTMRQTSLSVFAHYSKNDIEQDVIHTEDRKLLIAYEAHGHTLKYSARKRLQYLELMARVNR